MFDNGKRLRTPIMTSFLVTLLCVAMVTGQRSEDVNIPDGAASLAFVFDITGSMYDDLVQVIEGAARILATALSRREKPLYNYVLVPFHDPDVGPVVVTTDPDDFQHELRNLYVQGGGDCPEMSVSAIKEAMDVSLPNSFIYVFTDARSKDYYLTEEVLAMIQKKQSQVVFVLTGDCDDPAHEGYVAYEQIASTSSGQVFLLKKSQVNEVLNFVRVAVQSRKVNLMSIDVQDVNENDFNIPLDSKLQEVTISVSGQTPKISLVDPSGNKFTSRTGLKTLLDIRNALVVNVKDPQPGVWKMNVQSQGKHTIRVSGLSTTDFIAGFSRKPVTDMKDTEHRPIGGIATYLTINATDLDPPGGFSHVELFDLFGTTLGKYPLIRDELKSSVYTVPSFIPPEKFFYVQVSGVDQNGYNIQRQTPTAITRIIPSAPDLWMPEVTRGYFGRTAVITCQVFSQVPFTVHWYKEDVQQGPELYFIETTNVTLEIPGANQFAEGIYFCNATNVAGTRRIPTFLDISEPPPSITVPQNVSVQPGQDALLTCNVFSSVEYNLTWHRDGYYDRLRSSQKFIDFNNGSLLVRSVSLDDEGMFICRASNEGGTSEQMAFIRLQVVPTASIDPPEANFVLGQTKEFRCDAKGFPTPTVNWLYGGKLLLTNEKIRVNGDRLELRNLEKGDAGMYSCLAVNPAGEDTVHAALNYMEAPHISVYESKVLVASGDDAVLFCGADGIPQPEIHWYKGEVELKALSYVQISDSGQLRILGTHQLDAGDYKCEARNEAGSDSATVTLVVGSDPEITETPENLGVDIGGNATMKCKAEGFPEPRVFWQRLDGKKLNFDGKVTVLPTGKLFIQDVGLNDEGSYECVAQNQFGTTEESAYLSITGIIPPMFGYMDPVVQVVQGEDVELNCQVLLGNPDPQVMWIVDGQVVRTDEHITKSQDGTIIIEDVQDYHSGDYLCLATNVGGNASFIVSLEVQVPPSFEYFGPDDEKIDFNIIEGDRVVLPCNVEGDPSPIITWFKDESPISLTDYHYFIGEDNSLEIYSAEATDTALYRCQASNVAGEIEKILNLFVQVPPTIIGEPDEELVAIENETVVLPCVVSGIPPPTVTWRKNFVPFEPKSSDKYLFGNHGLTISEVKKEDKAIYECIADNSAGEESKVIVLVVRVPPVITEEGETDITVLKGEEVKLHCENSGDPVPIVDWKKDEATLSVFDQVNGFEIVDTGSLVIPSARVEQSGRYVCIVTNEAGITTRDFTLTVQDPPNLIGNLTKHKDVIEDNPIILHCPATGTPPPIITWYKDGSLVTGDQIGVVILEDGSLQILASEGEDSGLFKCVAENVAGKVERNITIKVLIPPKLTGKDQGQEGVVDTPKVIVTENTTLTCPVEADPAPTITWLKNGYELSPSTMDVRYEISPDGKELTIFTAEVSDTARYKCRAENVAGETEKSFDLDVYVPPSIDSDSVSPENNTVVKDSSMYLDCPVTGIPRPKVFWYKDGDLLNADLDDNLRVHADGRRLEIVGARVSDTGAYTCAGENIAGTVEKTFYVDVQVSPIVDRPGEINKPEVITNGTKQMTCPAYGVPPPDITWYKNNQLITANTSQLTLLDDGWTLEIVSAQVEDTARYTCRATNPAGESEKTFDLNVLVPPMINIHMIVLDAKVIRNQSTVINCPVDGKPTPTITWFKNGIQLDATVQSHYEILAGGRQLRVKKAELSDTATFQCLAENRAGTDSVDIDLRVLVPSRIDIRRTNTNPKVVVNGSVSITCPATGVPPPTIVWFKDGDELTVESQPNIELTDNGRELILTDAQVWDTARYTCRASNEAGESEVNYQVDVQVPPTIDDGDVDDNPHVIIDNSVTLNCPAVGVPSPGIIWLKDGQPIDYDLTFYRLEAEGQRLTIDKAQLTDEGMYTCVAANEAGSVEQNYVLEVWVAPQIDSTNLDLSPTMIKGRSTTLFCPTVGNPTPAILWLKDNEPVDPLNNRIQIDKDGLQLKITNASTTDTARYTCVARNPAGQDSLSFDLQVFVPPSIDESNVVYFRKVVENRTIIIECPVSGIPVPEVLWLINGHPAVAGPGLGFTHNNYHLELASAQVSDSAVYTCVASNAAGELQKKFNLEVQVPPRIDRTRLETSLTVIQNRSRSINCPVYGIPEPSIIWFQGKVPLLDWPYQDMSLANNEQRLDITNAQVEYAGTYTCQATNPAGQDKQDFKLEVYIPPQIAGSEIVSDISVVKGSTVTLDCQATGIPVPQLAWIKDGEVIEISQNPHIRILNNGRTFQITSSEVEDAGRYICHAENKAGIAERLFDLDINVPPRIEAPSGVNNVWVIANEPLTLECPAEGVPPPVITWHRQGKVIQRYGNPGLRLIENSKKLLIVSAQLLDMGDYECRVENAAGNASLEYNVNVYVPPTIDGGPEQVQAVVNTGATLLCESLGLPDPIITWIKDGANFPSTGLRHRMRVSGTIEFTSVRLEDAGHYKCIASNEAGTTSREMTLDVQVPPRMVGRQPVFMNAVAGEGVVVPCDVTGTPKPVITWQKGTSVIRGGPGRKIIGNGSLYLQETSESDSGVYVCIAQNSAGTAFGQIRLRIFVPPTIQVRETKFVINNAQNIVLPCRAKGRPRPVITWEKNGVPISRSDAYLRLLRNGLAIPFARPEDAATYTCIATNKAGSRSVELHLTVQVPPQIGEASRLLTFTVRETADIQCAAIGIPPPTIRWLKEGRELDRSSGKYDITEFGNLIIRDLSEDDTGSYLCSATNVAGQANQERLVRIQVPPTFIVVPQVQEVLLDSRLELRCTADGIPTPTIHWKRDELPIPSQPSVNGRSVFILHNVRSEDGGVYTCLAQNPAGEAEVNTIVNVKIPPEILTPPGNKAVTIAERVVLTCSVGGDPPPEVIWMKNGRPVELSDRIRQLRNASLVIYDSTSSDAGEYKCVATNDAGTSEGVAMLTVREPPSFLLEPQHTRVDQGETVRLDCMGFGEPEPKIEWMVGWDVLEDAGRLSILPNNSLRIVAAQLSDSGTYRCMASNNLGKVFIEVNITVVVHGKWSVWSSWETCSTSCGEGTQLRHRSCDNPKPANQGRMCDGNVMETRTCVIRQCPVSGNWGNWLHWEQCSVPCDEGERVRRRMCDNPRPQLGGDDCVGEPLLTEPCNRGPCSVDGGWGSWNPWQPCSRSCGEGIQERTRSCDNPSPSNRGQYCSGSDVKRQPCKLAECPVDGVWNKWGHWSSCTLSCEGGTSTRSRQCNNPVPQYGGLTCAGSDTQLDYCNNEPCPVHGGWSEWGSFGECSVSCNRGLSRRFRTCSNPQPSNNGRPCPGPSDNTQMCNQKSCPIDGFWTDWSAWNECSRSCDKGKQTRVRTCRQPKHGGLSCRGDREQIMDCMLRTCYNIPVLAEGTIVGFINSVKIPAAKFSADMIPLPDNSATHVNATIRNLPSNLVPHFRHLISVLAPIYWTTAMEIDGASNGYTLTDGDFAREVQVQYTTGEILKMSHYSKGVDRNGKLQLDIVLRGNVPEISEGESVKVQPYWEQYTQTGAGGIHAQSTRLYHVDGYMLPYAWNHSITYNNVDNKMPYLVQRLYARNMDVVIEPEKEMVQFRLDTSIAPGSPSNQCPSGFTMNPDGPYCEDEDECAGSPCSDFCHNSMGSYYCSCPIGFTLTRDGKQCADIDECNSALTRCPGDQQCTNTIGSYRCHVKCRRGLRPSDDGLRCEDINECEEDATLCDQICVNRRGDYRCRCMPGYRRSGRRRCVDINECELRNSPCEQVCANAQGSYLCSCRQGYELVSTGQCRDINECTEGGATCPPGQDCINSQGSYRCIAMCPKGSELVNGRCTDIDECATRNHRCYYNQRCVNTEPGYRCICPRGYRSAGPGTPCLDLDECTETPGICSYQCENTYGGYECICAPGQIRLADRKSCAGLEFLEPAQVLHVNNIQSDTHRTQPVHSNEHGVLPNGRNKRAVICQQGWVFNPHIGNCTDINECEDDPGICQHNCSNTVGGYECSCPPGYRISKDKNTCEDINECIEFSINCGADKMCFNTLGEFTCIDVPCPTKYQRDPISNNCVLECIDAEIACPESATIADVIEFRTLALPSGVLAQQDLIRLTAYNQNNDVLRKTLFRILENDKHVPFQIRLDNGIGIVYTPKPLEDSNLYRIKVLAKSYDNEKVNIQYQTTFMIHISVSAYPY